MRPVKNRISRDYSIRMVYLFTYHRIPDGDASSLRFVAIAKIFMDCGYDVVLVGMGDSEYLEVCEFEGVPYLSLRLKGKGRTRNYWGFKTRIKEFLSNVGNIEAVVVNQLPINALRYFKNKSKKYNIPLFVDCCEWYSPEQFKFGRINIQYLLKEYFVRGYIDKYTYPISISKYLTSYFNLKSLNPINIPVVFDVVNIEHNKEDCNHKKLVLMYAGSVGRKDYLDVVLTGLSQLPENELSKIELRIFGAELSEVEGCLDKDIFSKVSSCVRCYGRVDRKTVLQNLKEADFTVLMRSSEQRYAKAGFPTKVVESLAIATPVICNITSDLGDYVEDGHNGVVVKGDTSDDFCKAIQKSIYLSADEKRLMQKNARITAENYFDYRTYCNQIDEIMNNNSSDLKYIA